MKTSLRENVFKYVFIQKGRSLILFFLLAVVNVCAFAQRIDAPLREEMSRRSEDEKIKVYVIMKPQYDRTQLNRRAGYYSNRRDKRDYVVNELKQFAEASQYDIKESLTTMEKEGLITEPTVLWVANALSFSATKSVIEDLAKRSDIEVIGFDQEEYMLFDEESKPVENTREMTQNIIKVRANEVWSLGYTGSGVVVAVVDTGVNYDHLDLADHLWDGGVEFPHHGWDFVNNDNDPMDDHGHGTHCAGTVCGDGTAGSQTGMAPDATLMILKCLNASGRGSTTNIVNAMQWAVEHGCDVISMSLGGSTPSALYRNTCASILDAGVVAAIAAGNNGDDLVSYPVPNNVHFPGGCPPPYLDPQQTLNPGGLSCSVCVGAVDYDDSPASFTSRGPVTWAETEFADYPYSPNSAVEFGLIRPDVCAPGVNIKSANYASNTGYTLMDGTSMATPCVAGCMALILSKDPNVTPAEMCKLLEETSIPLSDTKSNLTGTGRIDVMAAISNMPSGSLKLNSFSINDSQGNNDHLLNPGEQVDVGLTLLNDSDLSIDNASLVLSTESNHVSITNGTVQLPHFNGQQTQTIENAFSFSLGSEVLPGTVVAFTIEMKVNDETVGVIPFSVTVYDYHLHYKELVVLNDDNGNSSLEPGESADLRIYIENGGNTQANSLVGGLGTNYSYLTLNETTKSFGNIASGGQSYAEYHVTLGGNAPQNYNMDLSLTMTDANNRQTVLEFDHVKYAINATVNIEGSGSITGTGYYDRGTTCTLSITPSEGYLFENWSKEGALEHTTMSYSFVATENVEYVANLIVQNGVYIGSGEDYDSGLPGATSGYNISSLSQQIYTADEIGQAGYIRSIAFYNDGYFQRSNYSIYLKHTEKSAFESNTDWESVSISDLVFSSQFVFPIGVWTVLEFDALFEYNGTSNLLLVVDDNSGTRDPVFGRAYDGNGYQSIYLGSTSSDIDPLDVTGMSGSRKNKKNQIILDIVDHTTCTVSVAKDIDEAGVVTGAGTYDYGAACTVTATANEGYAFRYWMVNGAALSYDNEFSFTVKRDLNLTAVFSADASIPFADANVKALCVANWDTNGDGELSFGEAAAVTDLGQVFKNNSTITTFDELQCFNGLTEIGDRTFYSCSRLVSVVIPNSVTAINTYAFAYCYYLTTVVLPNSLPITIIGSNAFANCSRMTSITIPSSVTTIGSSAFYSCSGLASIAIPESVASIGNSAFQDCTRLEQIIVDEGNTVFDSRDNCNAIIETESNTLLVGCKNSIIPNTVVALGNYAFRSTDIVSVNIPESVMTIGDNVFGSCHSLEQITVAGNNPVFDSRNNCNAIIESSTNKLVVGCMNTIIPEDVTAIDDYAFYYCTGLTSMVLPNTVTTIGQYAFAYCYSLTALSLPNSLTTIGSDAFINCNKLASISLPGSVSSIENFAFYYCTGLTSITSLATVPPAVTGNYAFNNVDKTIPVHVPVGSGAAYSAANGWSDFTNIIEDANLPINFADANVKAICVTNWDTNNDGELSYAEAAAVTDLGMKFAANYTITSFDELQFFTGLTAIGADAFLWCHSLSSVVLPNTVTELRVEAFYDCRSLLAITIPASVNSIDPSALNCPNMETLVVEEGNAVYDSRNNCNALILTSENCLVRGCKNTIIPNTVVAIGSNAFSNSAIETVDIPESVSTIYSTSFYACVELSSITVATGNTVYDSRNHCNAIVETNTNTLIAGSISTVIPNTVTSIGAYAFSYRFRSDLHQITIPESIVSIGYGAYMGGYGIEAITVLAEVPPVLGDNVFENVSVDIPVTVPCGTTAAYASATGWSEFTNYQVDASCSYEITAVANPSEGGTVTGNGTYNHNATCTLTATPATGYSFVNWTKDNVEVSTNQEYTFTAIQSGEYQANFSLNSYEITAVANDASLGTVVGGGTYYYGETVTLTATANTGALFRNWTEGGTVVSTDETYSFTTTNDRSIVANFEAIVNHWMPISGNQYNMSVYGIVLIDGVEQMCATLEVGAFCGDECRASACAEFFPPTQQYVVTLTIRSNTDSGEIITFRLYDHHTQQEMALNCASTVTFESNAMIGVNDWFPFAFCNTNNVSVTLSPDGAGIVAGAGDYDWGTTATLTASANEGYAFVGWSDNGVMVSTDNPYSFEVTESVTLIAVFDRVEVTALSAGWHWWSTAIELSGLNGLTMLENSLGHYGLEVKSQSASMQNYYQTIGYDYWFGTLTTAGLQNENGYMVRVSDPCSITMTGSVANPSDHPITIESNWNWIGYPVGATQSVSVAMGGVSPESNDVIKGQGWTSTYYSGYGWFPTTPVLSPGNMYMYYSNAVENKTLTFANNREIVAVVNEDPLQWNANTHAYAHNLVVMAMVSVNGKEQRDESLEVGAFVDGECRGSARLIYFEPLDRYYVMMTVSGMEGEHVGFKLINQEKETMNSENGIVFKTDDIVGSLDNPFTLHFNQMSQDFGVVTIYPNPVERGQKLTLLLSDNELPNKVVFYDAMGAMVSSESGDVALSSIKAPSTSGIYTMELVTRTGNVYRCKLVVR